MEVLLSEKQIKEYVWTIANAINRSETKPDVLICTLTGALPFFSDLIKYLDFDFEIDFVKIRTYIRNGEQDKNCAIWGPFDIDLKGRNVLIVEDIVDSGYTLNTLYSKIKGLHTPANIKFISLLKRKGTELGSEIDLDYCFEVEDDSWLIGYGLDDNQKKRNLKDIYVKR